MKTDRLSACPNCYTKSFLIRGLSILLFIFILTACSIATPQPGMNENPDVSTLTAPTADDGQETIPRPSLEDTIQPSLFEVYFTDPYDAHARTRPGYIDDIMVYAIDQATDSVDVAVLNLSDDDIGEALLRAERRGVSVRMVMESDNIDSSVPRGLMAAGIPIVGDNSEGLMHNKFIIIDSQEVWSGSMNFTDPGIYGDHNNMVRIRSSRLAEDYTTEFNEMFEDGSFGSSSPSNTPYPQLSLDGTVLEVYFSPDDGAQQQLENLIHSAEDSIDVLAFSFTSDPLAEALIQQAASGIQVRIVMDEEQAASNQGGEYDHFLAEGLDVHLDANYGQMHHKVMIFDDKIVAFGSYNYSRSAEERNDENLLIVYDPSLAAAFLHEFESIYERSE